MHERACSHIILLVNTDVMYFSLTPASCQTIANDWNANKQLFDGGVSAADIAPGAVIGPGFRISHGVGIVIGNGARIGERCLMMQGVTVGAPSQSRIGDMPTVGDDVVIGAGACLIGKIQVGSGVLVGVNTVLTRDVPDHSKVLPPSGMRVIQRGARQEEKVNP